MLIKGKDEIVNFCSKANISNNPRVPFDNLVIEYLKVLYEELKKNINRDSLADIHALLFWLRPQNINKIKRDYENSKLRQGLGIIFHITPSNMPINFFYSYLFGLLSGNINIVRVPSKNFTQTVFLMNILDKVLHSPKFEDIKNMSNFISYEKDDQITENLSKICNCRVIWGGDKTVDSIRRVYLPAKSREITFCDKFSLSIINLNEISNIDEKSMETLVKNFFTDGYLIDQNACSSPHIIIWKGLENKNIKKIFWDKLEKYVGSSYEIPDIAALDKYTKYCEDLIKLDISKSYISQDNGLHVMTLKKLPENSDSLKSKWGYFYEFNILDYSEINSFIDDNFQTVTYFGIDKKKLINFILDNNIRGVDRIVPIGQAHVIDTIWDGYDLILSMSRIIH